MWKKAILSLLFILGLTATPTAFAEDVWAYTYPNGMQAYICTNQSQRLLGSKLIVKVKNVFHNHIYSKPEYIFGYDEGAWRFGYRYGGEHYQAGGLVTDNEAAMNILNVALDNL